MKKFVRLVVLMIVVTVVASFVGREMGRRAAKNDVSSAVVRPTDQVAPLITAITIQDTEGMSEADLDLDALKRLEQHLVTLWRRKARTRYGDMGFDPATFNPKVDVRSVYMEAGGKKVAVIKMNVDRQVRVVWIMGFHRGQFLRVSCIRRSNHDILLFSGECGQKVSKAFGTIVQPQPSAPDRRRDVKPASINSKMIEAAQRGELAAVAALVAKGADVNARTGYGYSALSGASGKGHTEVVRFLLDKGVDVNERLRKGTNALDEASFWGRPDTVKLLLARGGNPNAKKDNGFTPLLSAAINGHLEVVNLLLDHGADVNAKSESGGTALHAAAVQKHAAVINLLLKRGASPEIKNRGGYSYEDLLTARQ